MKRLLYDVIFDVPEQTELVADTGRLSLLTTVLFWVVCLVIVSFFLREEIAKRYKLAVVFKGAASLAFVMLGVMGYEKASVDTVFAGKVLTGLCLGMLADVLLNLRYLFQKNGQKVFLLGILVFLAGHVMYIVALAPRNNGLLLSLVIAVVLAAALLWWVFKQISAEKAFKIFGVFYLGTIMIMTCVAIGVLISDPQVYSSLFAIGALMFLGSDIILILNTFGSESKNSLRIANILLYYTGQLLIATSLQFV